MVNPRFQFNSGVIVGNRFSADWQRQLSTFQSKTQQSGAVWTGQVHFTAVSAQTSQDFTVQFPTGQAPQGTCCPVLGSPTPPANSCFTAHVGTSDQVIIRLNNYSTGPLTTSPQTFSLLILPVVQS